MPGLLGIHHLGGGQVSAQQYERLRQSISRPQGCSLDEYISPKRTTAIARIHKNLFNPDAQPVTSPDGRYHLFLDGEIFNDDLDIEHQPESVLDTYLQIGERLFPKLNGSFSVVIYEPVKNRLQIVADRVATVPIYYVQHRDLLLFAGEIKPLIVALDSHLEVNPLALENYLASGFILDGQTLIKGIYSLRPGEVLTAENGELTIERYWRFKFSEPRETRDRRELEEELARLCAQAVRRQTQGSYKMAVPISGGYDSRSILFLWKQQRPEARLNTVTWGVDEKQPQTDAWVARRLSKQLKTEHHFFPLVADALPDHFHTFVHLDEGRTDAVGNYPEGLRIFENIRHELGIQVLLRGNEIFGARRKVFRNKDVMHTAFMDDLTFFPDSFGYLKPKVYKYLADIGQEQMRQLHELNPYDDPVDRKDYLFVTLRCSGYQSPLTQIKRQVIEERNPYLDNDIMDFVATLPPELRIWKNLFMSTVRNRIPTVGKVEFSQRVSLIDWDEQLIVDSKLQALVTRTLLEQRNEFDDIFDQKKLRRLLEMAFQPKKDNRQSLVQRANRKLRERLDQYDLEVSLEIFRLMILKIWTDEVLRGEFRLQ